jgi:hypothetical protein
VDGEGGRVGKAGWTGKAGWGEWGYDGRVRGPRHDHGGFLQL